MPGDDRKIGVLACVLLVMLRLSIGWHLLYEGVWKIQTQKTASPWSSEGYLKNATGPLRPVFRDLTGDPDDLSWLDYDKMSARWDGWALRFVAHYSTGGDGEKLQAQLTRLIEGPGAFSAPLESLPEGVDPANFPKAVRFDPKRKLLICDAKLHLLPSERDSLLAMAPLPEGEEAPPAAVVAYRNAVERLFNAASSLSYRERLAVLLKADPERAGLLVKEKDGSEIEKRIGDIELYKQQARDYERRLQQAKVAYQFEHLDRVGRELSELRKRLLGPVKGLDLELRVEAEKLLNEDQLSRGALPPPMTSQRSIDLRTMYSLAIIGLLLIAGLFTRLAALAGAGLLTLFYLAAPPWPGVPEVPGPEHNLIVNKVSLEALTLLAFAFLPSGRWFGIDALLAALFRRRAA